MKMLFIPLLLAAQIASADIRPNYAAKNKVVPKSARQELRVATQTGTLEIKVAPVVQVKTNAVVAQTKVATVVTGATVTTVSVYKAPPPPPPSLTFPSTIKVTGSTILKNKILAAIAILEQDAEGYSAFLNNLKEIRGTSGRSCVDVFNQIFYLNIFDAPDSHWLASALVHEAYHVIYSKTNTPYWGTLAELYAIKAQYEFLIRINGPKHMIDYLKKADGTHWMNN